jgi:hypothetical protein
VWASGWTIRVNNTLAYLDNNQAEVGTPDLVLAWSADEASLPTPTVTPYQLLEQYNAPDENITAVFVPGHGIYTERGEHQGQPYYNLLGESSDAFINSLTADANGFYYLADGGGSELFSTTAPSAVPWGDIWQNSIIIPTPITQGELDAGVTVSGAGQPDVNGNFTANVTVSGGPIYPENGIVSKTSIWNVYGYGDPYEGGSGAFPWESTFAVAGNAVSPAPTVTRNDLASLASWTQINDNVNNAYVPASAPIQPPQAFVSIVSNVFDNGADIFDGANKGITYVAPVFLGNWIFMANISGGTKTIILGANYLTSENIDALLIQAASNMETGFFFDLSGQTPPAPLSFNAALIPYVNLMVVPNGTHNGKTLYGDLGGDYVAYNGTTWVHSVGPEEADFGSEEFPWLASWPAGVVTGVNYSKQTLQDNGWTVITD